MDSHIELRWSHGRRFFARGKLARPGVVRGASAWSQASPGVPVGEVPVAECALIADEWRQNGAQEHAAIAAYHVLAQNLIALGAPPQLVADA